MPWIHWIYKANIKAMLPIHIPSVSQEVQNSCWQIEQARVIVCWSWFLQLVGCVFWGLLTIILCPGPMKGSCTYNSMLEINQKIIVLQEWYRQTRPAIIVPVWRSQIRCYNEVAKQDSIFLCCYKDRILISFTSSKGSVYILENTFKLKFELKL